MPHVSPSDCKDGKTVQRIEKLNLEAGRAAQTLNVHNKQTHIIQIVHIILTGI